jgi:ATP-binding cassette subfamily B protein
MDDKQAQFFDTLIQTQLPESSEPLLRLLGLALRKAGNEVRELSFRPLDVAGLIDLNNILSRATQVPTDLDTGEYPVLIVTSADTGLPYVLYRENAVTYFYDAYANHLDRWNNQISLEDSAYEIYSSLPHQLRTGFQVIGFSLRGIWTSVAMLAGASLLLMLFNLLIPVMNNYLVERVLPESNIRLLTQGLFIGIIVVTFSVVFQYLQTIQMLRIETVADLKLQTALMDRLMKLPMEIFHRYSVADLSSRVLAITQLRQLLSSGIFTTMLSSLFAVTYFGLMFFYSFQLAVWATALTLVAVIYVLWLAFENARIQLPAAQYTADLTNQSLQSLQGLVQIRTSGSETLFLGVWGGRLKKLLSIEIRQMIYADLFSTYTDVIVPIGSLLLFALIVPSIVVGDASTLSWLVVYISFNSAFSAFNRILTSSLSMLINVGGQSYVLLERARPVLFARPEEGYSPVARCHDLNGSFSIESLSFTYPNRTRPTLDGFDLQVGAGQNIAITGPSGSGKTTLFRLLLGFVTPQEGSIHVDSIHLSRLAIRYYRRQVGVVMQDSALPNGSISQIICGGQDFSEEQIWDALEQSNVADEVHSMPMKLQTLLNQGALNISGGQRQRIALARALIKKPKVLLLDEATSALDNESQAKISSAIQMKSITRISIAHRLSTIRDADCIHVIEQGRVSRSGTWSEIGSSLTSPAS